MTDLFSELSWECCLPLGERLLKRGRGESPFVPFTISPALGVDVMVDALAAILDAGREGTE